MNNQIIDVDRWDTWPHQIVDVVDRWANELKGTTEYSGDLALPLEYEEEFRELLSGFLIRAYHCTRLLPHEVRMVKKMGLCPLTSEFLFDRIKSAQEEGIISAADARTLHEAHVFATGEHQCRENQVCLILSKKIFHHSFPGCEPLLTSWGGEGIYKSSKRPPVLEHLNSHSKPAIVVTLLDLGGKSSPHKIYPALHKVFVGARLCLSDLGADVFYKAHVSPENVESILQSGETQYESLLCSST